MRNLCGNLFTALAALAILGCGGGSSPSVTLAGSGSSFVKPLMDKWIDVYSNEHGGAVNYQSQGSSAGVKQMMDEAVNFGCTDAFMKKAQLDDAAQRKGEVLHIPIAMGAIAVAYNVPGVDKPLKFTGEVLAGMFLGTIANWNDEKIQKLNPDVKLPDLGIAIIHRADGSGSTSIFTEYLSKVSPEWKEKVGSGTVVNWPAGIGEQQTAGVAGGIGRTKGGIGYIELLYALQNKIQFAAVENREHSFVLASSKGVSRAADSLKDLPEDLRFSLTDAPGADSYPIGGTVWAVMYVNQPPNIGKPLADFFRWAAHAGQKYAEEMDYAPLPESLVKRVDEQLLLIK